MSLRRFWLAIAFSTVWVGGSCHNGALASTFLLTNGGQIEGRLLNPDQQPRSAYEIEVAEGGRLVLRADQVQQVLTISDEIRWYQQQRPKVPNTVEGHWEMAEQCRQRNLSAQREHHLNQVLQLDADHREARLALGFSRVKDQWIKTDEWMQSQGLVRYRGAWRTPQDIALEKAREQADLSEKQWLRKIQNWRTWILKGRGREQQALAALRAIEDPAATAGLIEIIENEKNPPELRRLCIQVLGRMKTPRSIEVFVQRALQDSDPNIRDACLDELKRFGTKQAVWRFQALLRSPDNKLVNRAGLCLGVLRDPEPTRSLIDALVTEHKYLLQPAGGPGQMNLGFGSGSTGGGGTFGVGGRPKIIQREHKNDGVLSALVAIWQEQNVNFGYDQDAWRAWLADQQGPATATLRRDD
jgi:hypothetical protein